MEEKTVEVRLAEIYKDLEYLRRQTDAICAKLDSKYVTKDEFAPIKKIAYGLVAVVMTSVVLAILALVLKGL